MLSLFLAIVFVVQLVQSKPRDDTIVTVPATFYRGTVDSSTPGEINYFEIDICNNAASNYTQAQLNIILPDNPTWNLDKAYVIAELSTSSTNWNGEPYIFGTNYIWGGSAPTSIYSNITWDMSSVKLNGTTFYLRVMSEKTAADYTFEIIFTDNRRYTNGEYNANAFNEANATPTLSSVDQYIKNTETYNVANYDDRLFYFTFCPNNFNRNNDDFTLIVSVVSVPEAPKSAFTLVVCSANKVSPSNCVDTAPSSDTVQKYQQDTSVASIQVQNNPSGFDVAKGVYTRVYGYGGEIDGINLFALSATIVYES